MGNKVYGKIEWQEFRKEILELVILYHHVKEYANFKTDRIKYIESFFHLSRKQAITSFFIKVGFLVLKDGNPSLFNFLSEDSYSELYKLYEPKFRVIRNKYYAHSDKAHEKLKAITLTNDDIEDVYSKIISLAQEIDAKYNDSFNYDMVSNARGIKSIEHFIEKSIELNDLKKSLLEHNFKAKVELEIMSGKIKILGAL